jgi:methionine-gamma-lyase
LPKIVKMEKQGYDPSGMIFDLKQFGEYGDVNPSITDSSTYTFLAAQTMLDTFQGESEGCFLYSRHWNPSNKYLSDAMAALEGAKAGWVTASGMAAITTVLLQLCNAGDHMITSVTTYGGTFAFLQNYLPKFNIDVTFVNISDLEGIEKAIRPNTRLIYTETLTNPLLQVSDIPRLVEIARRHDVKLIVDNTFAPLIISPSRLGADITVYSMTKFVNGKNDCVAGAICSNEQFINEISNVNDGTAMLLGPVLDPLRSSSILKNLHTLHIRMQKHSRNTLYVARRLEEDGMKVIYPGLASHPDHELMKQLMHPDFGFGGMMAIDLGTAEKANLLMEKMQNDGVGYLAVSLGYFKTLFSNPGKSTSSEVPEHIRRSMGLSEGLIRFSMGLDHDIEKTCEKIVKCIQSV